MTDHPDAHRVRVIDRAVSRTVVVVLRLDGERALPTWAPGAHVDVVLPSGQVRQYSATPPPLSSP